LPPDLEWVVGHCLGKDPAKRFQNVGDLAAALCPFAAPRSRIVADRCRYVLDPTTAFDELEETTGPVSWNGVNTGLDTLSSSGRMVPHVTGPSRIERVTVVARRVVRERKQFAPLAAVTALGLVLGTWRALSPGSAPMLSSQTILAAPGRGSEPTVAEVFEAEEAAKNLGAETSANSAGETTAVLADTAATATTERQAHASAKVAPRRPAPPARPKAPAGSSSSEPDVGF
jgi:serine/threonine-protein kinase